MVVPMADSWAEQMVDERVCWLVEWKACVMAGQKVGSWGELMGMSKVVLMAVWWAYSRVVLMESWWDEQQAVLLESLTVALWGQRMVDCLASHLAARKEVI